MLLKKYYVSVFQYDVKRWFYFQINYFDTKNKLGG